MTNISNNARGLKTLSIKNSLLAGVAFSTIAFAAPTVAIAQDEAAEPSIAVDEVVVTARNREENLQDIPLSITAFDEEALKRRSIDSLDDVARFTPGLSFEDFSGGFSTPVIRGQSTTRITALESNVSTFFDGIYIPRSWAVDVGTNGLSRVEVVKGPQSARYGRNAFAGAINYIPKKADTEGISAEAIGTFGSDERYDFSVNGNFPISDKLAVYAAYNFTTFDGSWENDHPFAGVDLPRGTQDNAGGYERESFNASVVFNPIDALTVELAYYNYDNANEYRPSEYFAESLTGDMNCGNDRQGTGGSLICGELTPSADSAVVDPRAYGTHSETDLIRFEASYDFTDAISASYLFGKIDGEVDTATSGEMDPVNCSTIVALYCNFQSTPIGGIEYESHEVRITYDGGGLFSGAIGAFMNNGLDESQFISINLFPITDLATLTPYAPVATVPGATYGVDPAFNIRLANERTTTEILSYFGELNFTSPDGRMRAGAEVRYSETEIFTAELDDGVSFDDTFNVVTPRFGIEYDLTDASMVYASIARGAKAGGFNAGAENEEDTTFDEEFNWTYEIGAKNTFMGGRLLLNGALYYTEWTDVQINSPDPGAVDPNAVNITLNLGNATVIGLELDAIFQATESLSFDATFSHADSTYDDGTVDARFARDTGSGAPCDDIVCSSSGDVGGKEVERTPPTQASLGAQWEGMLPNLANASYFVRGDVSWQSEFFATPVNLATIPDRTLLNTQAGLSFGNIDVNLWARNLTDEKYVSSAFVVILPFGNTYGNFLGDRRTFGATLSVRY